MRATTKQMQAAVVRIEALRTELFTLANDMAGEGNASLYIHEAVNNLAEAGKRLELGNPAESIPEWAIARSIGAKPIWPLQVHIAAQATNVGRVIDGKNTRIDQRPSSISTCVIGDAEPGVEQEGP